MTFSDKRVVDFVRQNFVAVWESVSDVPVAVFDLGDGRHVKGTVGGEIAIYFCRPDGKVFDILPALQSPQATYNAMVEALRFYRSTGATEQAVSDRHALKLAEMDSAGRGWPNEESERARRQLKAKTTADDPGTQALGWGGDSKTDLFGGADHVTVVEPGGLDIYLRPIHLLLRTSKLRTPEEWKEDVFLRVLEQKLEGGERHYDVDSHTPLSLLDE